MLPGCSFRQTVAWRVPVPLGLRRWRVRLQLWVRGLLGLERWDPN